MPKMIDGFESEEIGMMALFPELHSKELQRRVLTV
jgi:hypothetical protein